MEAIEGSRLRLAEEMMELRRLRTAAMIEKCLAKNEVLMMCPKPRRQHSRHSWEQTDLKVGLELSDLIMNKASPPYYSGSPPIRANNPLIQDARFHEQTVQSNPTFGVSSSVAETGRSQSILTMG